MYLLRQGEISLTRTCIWREFVSEKKNVYGGSSYMIEITLLEDTSCKGHFHLFLMVTGGSMHV